MTMKMDDKEASSSCSSFSFPSSHESSVHSMEFMGMGKEIPTKGEQDRNSFSSSPSLLNQVQSINRSDVHLTEDNLMNGDQIERDMVAGPCFSPGVDYCYPPLLAVCVEVIKNSKFAVQWALDNLVSEGESIQIIHVKHPIQSIPTPMGNYMPIKLASKRIANAYRQQVDTQTYAQLLPYLHMCQSRKVHAQLIVLEENSVPLAIANYISRCHTKKIVMGSSSRNVFARILKSPDIPARVARIAPKFCTIYVVSKRKLVSIHTAISSNRISITFDDDASTVSGRTSNASSSSMQNPSRGKPEFEAINMLLLQCLPRASQDLSLRHQTTSPIIMNRENAELQSDRRIREEFSIVETHEFLGNKRSQELNAHIENESTKSGSTSGQYQLTEKTEAEGATCYNHKRRLQESAEISKVSPITEISDERFPSNGNQCPWDEYSDSDSYGLNQVSESLNPNTNIEESMFSIEGQFLSNDKESQIIDVDSVSSSSKEGVTKFNSFLETSNIKEEQCSRHLRFSSIAELAEENEAFFEIRPSDIQGSRPWVTSKVGVASKNLDKTIIEIHSSSSPPKLMSVQEETGIDLEELNLQVKHIILTCNMLHEEATSAKRKAKELDLQRVEEEKQLMEANLRAKYALAKAAEEKERRETAVAEAEVAKRIAEVEAKRRKDAELMITRNIKDISLVDPLASDNQIKQ